MTMNLGSKAALLLVAVATAGLIGCRRKDGEDIDQIGNAIGEVMASLDEAQGGTATAMRPGLPMLRTPDELRGPMWRRALDTVLPSAYAASCFDGTVVYSACSNGVRTKTFGNCSLGLATLDGTVTLTFNRTALCVVATAGDAVTRTADFTLTGLYGGTLAVTSPGGGETLTKTASGFDYTVGGMRRVLTGPAGRALFDVSTHTTAPIVVTGTSRSDLVIASGSLQVDHSLAHYSVSLTASNLSWGPSCNCAVSGSLTGTVSGGPHDGKSATVTVTGCGHADVTIDGETDSVNLDRCGAI